MEENSQLNKIALEKEISRKIVKEIENFGVSDEQKIDIMYFLALTLSSADEMKIICEFLKSYKKNININQDENILETSNKNIILE